MTTLSKTDVKARTKDQHDRGFALLAAVGLSVMAVVAPFAQFGVLASLIVPNDASATAANIADSPGLFSAAIAAFLVVAILDIAVAWGLYVVLRPVNQPVARLVAVLRVIYAAAFAFALLNLVGIAQLVNGASAESPQWDQVSAQVAASVTAFRTGWDVALATSACISSDSAGCCTGPRTFRASLVPSWPLPASDTSRIRLGRIFVPGYTLTISTFTFVGEALLIVWLFKVAIKEFRHLERPRLHRGLAGRRVPGGRVMNALDPRHLRARIVGGIVVYVLSLRTSTSNVIPQGTSTRSPILAIVGSLAAGVLLAVALLLGPADGRLGATGDGVRAVRLRARLGPHGGADDALQCPAANLDDSAGRVPLLDRVRLYRAPSRSGLMALSSAGSGRRRWPSWPSGCSFRSGASCAAEVGGSSFR